jgi:hypothetical protein
MRTMLASAEPEPLRSGPTPLGREAASFATTQQVDHAATLRRVKNVLGRRIMATLGSSMKRSVST